MVPLKLRSPWKLLSIYAETHTPNGKTSDELLFTHVTHATHPGSDERPSSVQDVNLQNFRQVFFAFYLRDETQA